MSAERLFLRMCAHWPALGGDDEMAELRARDWLAYLRRLPPGTAAVAVDALIAGWTEHRAPRIGDVQEAARSVAYRESLGGPPALSAPMAHPEMIAKLVGEARKALTTRPMPSGASVDPMLAANARARLEAAGQALKGEWVQANPAIGDRIAPDAVAAAIKEQETSDAE